MEPDVERSLAGAPPPPIDKEKPSPPSSPSSCTTGKNDKDTLSLHSAVPSTIAEHDREGEKEDGDVELAQATSKASTMQPPAVKVPRARRRGLFARFTILAEVEEPKNYPRWTKWYITFIIALAAVAAPLGSAIILRQYPTASLKEALLNVELQPHSHKSPSI